MAEEGADADRDEAASDGDGAGDPFEADDAAAGDDPTASADDAADPAPLDDLAREVRERREAREARDADPVDDDPFETVDVSTVDDDTVWESFAEGESSPEEQVGLGADIRESSTADEYVVPKREFCQRCPHFTDPPEVACTHEATAIVEVVDATSFRVRNCPVVAEKRDADSL